MCGHLMKIQNSRLAIVVATLVCFWGAPSAVGLPLNFTAIIRGDFEVPPTASAAVGVGVFQLDTTDNYFSYQILFTDVLLSGTEIAAHIHGPAAPGANGPVIIPLPFGAYKAGAVDLDSVPGANPADLVDGLWYVNIHSTVFPGGEIRGQIQPVGAPDGVPVGVPDGSSSLLLLSLALPLIALERCAVSWRQR